MLQAMVRAGKQWRWGMNGMYWQLIGFGLTVGWMWLFFLGGPILVALAEPWPAIGESCFRFFLLMTALSYLTVGRRIGPSSLLSKKRLLRASAFLMSLSPGLIYLLLARGAPGSLSWLIYPLVAAGALGCVVLMMTWQETFTAMSMKDACFSYAGGITIASLLLFGGRLLDGKPGVIAVVLIPIPALCSLIRHLKTAPFSPPIPCAPGLSGLPTRRYPAKLIWLIVLFYAAGGLMYKLAALKYAYTDFFWMSNLCYLAVVIAAAGILYFTPDLDLRILHRPVLPLLAAGFILFPFLTGTRVLASFLLLQAGFALFDMYTWLLIVYIARSSPGPVPVLGFGMFWIIISMYGGNLAFSILSPLIPLQRQSDFLVIAAGLLTLLASLVFQENKETFSGWKAAASVAEKPGHPEDGQPVPRESGRPPAYSGLTPREAEILALILKGRNNPFISEKLNISPNTLKFHLRNIYQKFSVCNRQELLDRMEREETKK